MSPNTAIFCPGASNSRNSSNAARIAAGLALYVSLMIVASRASITWQRMGTGSNRSRAAAISGRSSPSRRPTATAASAAVR